MRLLVADIMETEAPTVSPQDSIEVVLDLMRRHELPGVAVIDSSGDCVGIITEEDLVLSGEDADLHLPHYFELFGGLIFIEPLSKFEKRIRKAVAATASDLMTEKPVTIASTETAEQAAKLIADRKHNRIPVVDNGVYKGVVTRLDVLDAITKGGLGTDDD